MLKKAPNQIVPKEMWLYWWALDIVEGREGEGHGFGQGKRLFKTAHHMCACAHICTHINMCTQRDRLVEIAPASACA